MSVATIDEEKGMQPTRLKTEGPLSEKDQQGQAIEQQRKVAATSLEKWRRLKEKMAKTLKK